jgi:hypothetical protein
LCASTDSPAARRSWWLGELLTDNKGAFECKTCSWPSRRFVAETRLEWRVKQTHLGHCRPTTVVQTPYPSVDLKPRGVERRATASRMRDRSARRAGQLKRGHRHPSLPPLLDFEPLKNLSQSHGKNFKMDLINNYQLVAIGGVGAKAEVPGARLKRRDLPAAHLGH